MKWRFTQTLIFRARVYPLIFRIGILSKNLNLEHVPIELQKNAEYEQISIQNSAQLGRCAISWLFYFWALQKLNQTRNMWRVRFECTKWTIKMAVLSLSNVQNENEPSWAIDLPCNQLIGYWLRSRQGANFINGGYNVMYKCSARQNAK